MVAMSRGKFQPCLHPGPCRAGAPGTCLQPRQTASPIACSGFIFIGFQHLAFWAEFHAKFSNPRGPQALWTCKTTNVTKIGLKLI